MVANKKSKKAARSFASEHNVSYRQAQRDEAIEHQRTLVGEQIAGIVGEHLALSELIGRRAVDASKAQPGDALVVPLRNGALHGYVSGWSAVNATTSVEHLATYDDATVEYRAQVDGATLSITSAEGDRPTFPWIGESDWYPVRLYYSGVLGFDADGWAIDAFDHLSRPLLGRSSATSKV